MKIIKYEDLLSEKNIVYVEDVVKNNGVIVYPTDTLYGLGGNFLSAAVMEKIDAAKKRKDMPYSAVVSDVNMMKKLVEEVPPVFYHSYHKLLPGKYTFLFKVKNSLDKGLVKGSDKIGIRIPDVPKILKLVEILGVPLISTSVNRSGQPSLNDPEKIIKEFSGEPVSLIIDKGPLPLSKGSTILDMTCKPIKCLRQGDVAPALDYDSGL